MTREAALAAVQEDADALAGMSAEHRADFDDFVIEDKANRIH